MADSQSAEDLLLQLLRKKLGNPSLSLEEALQQPLARLLLQTLQESLAPEEPETVTAARGDVALKTAAASDVATVSDTAAPLVRAAIEDTFDLTELELQSKIVASEPERAALLAASALVMIEGKRRLRLSDVRRAEILKTARGSEVYERVLRAALAVDASSVLAAANDAALLTSMWLRRFLTGEPHNLSSAPPLVLRAARDARERLRCVEGLADNVPPLDELIRRVGFAELLEPLRVLIGADGGWDGTPSRDRFVGRDDELRRLRSFVDELGSQGIGESIMRLSSRAFRTLSQDEKPWITMVEARGGLGKSTLLAKFVIDHALGQLRPFPFAYLDFDRAGLDAERPLQLLIEIARQVGFQFGDAQRELNILIDNIRAEFARTSANSKGGTRGGIRDPYAQFVEVLREFATRGRRAFLLVFDTLELVQWNDNAITGLATLISEFRDKGLDELCVVASGRADVPELYRNAYPKVKPERIKLEPLLVSEAREMADVLGRGAIGAEWQPSWSAAIAGPAKEIARRDPLAVRIAVDFIARADAPERQELANEVATEGFGAHHDFVARLYLKRIVNHVSDPRAQKLAWPGLVLRRVTREIARELLAPLCALRPEDVDVAFEALGREVWLVTRDRDGLRHRPDLRERTLPLMRLSNPQKFEEIARAAVDYFGRRRTLSPEDTAEWVYHRLLIGEDPETISRDIEEDVLPFLAKAEKDFPPDSAAASYVASRTARTRISPGRIQGLRPADALYHLSLTSPNTFELDDTVIDPAALDVTGRLRDQSVELTPPLDAWADALFIKTGVWQRFVPNRDLLRFDLGAMALRARLFWAVRVAPLLDRRRQTALLDECVRYVEQDGRRGQSSADYRSLVQLMALARLAESDMFDALDRRVARMLDEVISNSIPSVQAALRTTIVLGRESRGPALSLWLASRRHGSGDRVRERTFSLAEITGLNHLIPGVGRTLGVVPGKEASRPARFSGQDMARTIDRDLEEITSDVRDGREGERASRLARMFAARDEDWIVPFGYVAARARGRKLSGGLSHRLASYAYLEPGRPLKEELEVTDMLAGMRFADEAGDLPGFARAVLAECHLSDPAAADLRFLIEYRDAWSRSTRTSLVRIRPR